MTPEPRPTRGWIPDAPDRAEHRANDPRDAPGDRPDDPDDLVGDLVEQREHGVGHHRPSWWRRLGRGGRFVETWVPVSVRDARVDPGRRGALVLGLVAALAAVAAAVGVWRDRPEPRPVQSISQPAADGVYASGGPSGNDAPRSGPRSGNGGPTVRSGPSGPSGGSPAPARGDSTPAVLAVSVTGAVQRPGLVRVRAGSRVADAIAAAGGTTAEADITGLNVATVLADGDSVVVGTAGRPPGSGSVGGAGPPAGSTAAGVSGPVDLNSADNAALQELPGVGPVMAGNIIAWRDANGPFTSVDQLQEITGIGPARYAQLAPLVVVG
ncbi:MAG: helix-hairpin-helix domain-containing protein [Nakamurella sp.]